MRTKEEILQTETKIKIREWGPSTDVLKAMDIYADQFKASVKMPTDEEIKIETEKRFPKNGQQINRNPTFEDLRRAKIESFEDCAKWLRDKVQQEAIDPVAFAKWIITKSCYSRGGMYNDATRWYGYDGPPVTSAELLEAFREELKKK